MKDLDPLENQHLKHLQLFFYLVPVVGFFPALWTLYRRQGSREARAMSRLSVTMAIAWLSTSILLSSGSQISEFLTLRLLFINGMLTSGYFLASLWLMFRLSQRQKVYLPGISRLADKAFGQRES
jgi:hypothetical protein